jgi:hypothetical protein
MAVALTAKAAVSSPIWEAVWGWGFLGRRGGGRVRGRGGGGGGGMRIVVLSVVAQHPHT